MALIQIPKRRIAVHMTVVFVALLVAVGATLGVTQFNTIIDARLALVESRFVLVNQAAAGKLAEHFHPTQFAVELLYKSPVTTAIALEDRLAQRHAMAHSLDGIPEMKSIFVGYPDGDFLLVRRLADAAAKKRFSAPDEAKYLVQVIERLAGWAPKAVNVYYDAELREISRRDALRAAQYDPRTRPWFQEAYRRGREIETAPYVFRDAHQIGITIARGGEGQPVVGADIKLQTMSKWLAGLLPTEGSEIALVDSEDRLVAHSDETRLVPKDTKDASGLVVSKLTDERNHLLNSLVASAGDRLGTVARFRHRDGAYQGMLSRVELLDASAYRLMTVVPEAELFAHAYRFAKRTVLHMGGILLVGIVIIALMSRRIARPLRQLADDVGSVRQFDFSGSRLAPTRIVEIDGLAEAVAQMKETIRKFMAISAAIAGERDLDQLLRTLLDEIIATTKSRAAILYLADDGETKLLPQAKRLEGGKELTLDASEIEIAGQANIVHRAIAERSAVSETATESALAALSLQGIGDVFGQMPSALLATPLFNRSGDLIGAMLLIERTEIDRGLIGFTQALSSSAAISVETRQLIEAQRRLFESFLQLIASAIDAKSPYTGGHCARVPELTKMIAQAAEKAETGPYADFALTGEEWQAIHVASWLHDCGKVTTPEFVIDKATKLETIYDRIHEVRMRIEVMKRDAEIAYLKDIAANGETPARRQAFDAEIAQLDDDFAFLADCNVGGEFMSDEDIARLQALSEKTWTRTLDDRRGISEDEKRRRAKATPKPLPATEKLIADGAEHRFERPDSEKLGPDNPWGFKVDVPELLYDRGELYNLAIRRGTLTEEDRYKINEHIIQTIKMLEALPFPKHLREVPEIAGGHHEKMDGSGYPKRLARDEMSPVARMMAVADIFEALTASDRPYKKAKTLSEALRIISFMVKDSHIDPEIFDLFLTSRVYAEYAEKFLAPEQIDAVDIADYRPAADR